MYFTHWKDLKTKTKFYILSKIFKIFNTEVFECIKYRFEYEVQSMHLKFYKYFSTLLHRNYLK